LPDQREVKLYRKVEPRHRAYFFLLPVDSQKG
jgi:hypothetical protein